MAENKKTSRGAVSRFLNSIRGNLVIAFLLVAIIPLVGATIYSGMSSRATVEKQVKQ